MGKYTKSEKWLKAKENSFKSVEGINEQYWLDFEQNAGKSQSSMPQYKSAVRRVLEHNENKDALTITIKDIESYLEKIDTDKTRENQRRYINSFLTYTITSNMDKSVNTTDSNLILSLIPQEYKGLMKVLLNK